MEEQKGFAQIEFKMPIRYPSKDVERFELHRSAVYWKYTFGVICISILFEALRPDEIITEVNIEKGKIMGFDASFQHCYLIHCALFFSVRPIIFLLLFCVFIYVFVIHCLSLSIPLTPHLTLGLSSLRAGVFICSVIYSKHLK